MHGIPDLDIGEKAHNLLISKVETAAVDLPKGRKRKYRRLLVTAEDMRALGLTVNDAYAATPTLVVPGTSISFAETAEYLTWLLNQGYPVASIENPIGGIFDAGINPKLERPLVLAHFLDHLQDQGHETIEKVIGLFQSYAAFDVVRLIAENPGKYRDFMPVFFLDNPAGFNGPISLFAHVLRWQFKHMGGGLIKQVLDRFWEGAYPVAREDAARNDYKTRERQDLWTWWKNTLRNPIRGCIREPLDICSYRTEDDMQKILEAGYEVGMFKHAGDQILPLQRTLEYARHLFSGKLIILDGGHNDLFAQKKNRKQIVDTMYTDTGQHGVSAATAVQQTNNCKFLN